MGVVRIGFAGIAMSIAGSALWTALDQNSGALATAVNHAHPARWIIYPGAALLIAGASFVWTLCVESEIPDSTQYWRNVAEFLMMVAITTCISVVPVGIVATIQVLTGAQLGGILFDVLAYFAIGVAGAGLAACIWVPPAFTILALQHKLEKSKKSG